MDFHSLRVARVDPLTDDAVAITFDVPDHLREAYAFTPGQHLTIRGDDGERRSYSICVPPSAGVLRIGVKRLPGGGFSDVVVGKLAPGDELDVMTPAGRFTHVPDPTGPDGSRTSRTRPPSAPTSPWPPGPASPRSSRSSPRCSRGSRGRSSPSSTPTAPTGR